jgi:hypothetical protein
VSVAATTTTSLDNLTVLSIFYLSDSENRFCKSESDGEDKAVGELIVFH